MDAVSRAQNSANTKIGRPFEKGNAHRFQSGRSGNPGGRPKKFRITKMYEQLLAKGINRKEISASILTELKKEGMAKVLLLREMAERTEGKVAQEVDMNISGTLALAEVIQKRRKKRGDSDNES